MVGYFISTYLRRFGGCDFVATFGNSFSTLLASLPPFALLRLSMVVACMISVIMLYLDDE